ncbi:hypothetical protein WMY93_010288 [Mugilogobius chulae]|uniref:Calponin-homology (CH) domain-containing protein n=1 Tax=Mugilogobius chulae TaxID=88201 RepID=A0AAW0PAR9_9GOBI
MEETHQPECAVEKTPCDKNNNNQIADAEVKENTLQTTEEETSKDPEKEVASKENEKDGECDETKREAEQGLDESQEAKGNTEQDKQDHTTDNISANDAESTSAENTNIKTETEDEIVKESDKKQENTTTNNEENVKEAVPNKTEKKKASKGKDTDVKSDGGKKGKTEEAEKPAKKKSGPSASALAALSRPRTSARSSRASNKKDIIAKFQQGAPETPVPRNFKLQRSAAAGSTGASIKQKVLQWCISKTRKYEGVNIENFSSSWCDGMAFCALIHRFFPDAFDFSSLDPKEREKNFTLAFQTAETLADCCPLLEVSDMLLMGNHPDPMCVFTYVQSLCHSLSKIEKQRKDKAEKESVDKKEEDEAQEETEMQDSGTSEGSEDTQITNDSQEPISEKEGDVSKSEETDNQATVAVES